MARKTTNIHPDWALKFKKPGTELRFQRGRYYLYKVSSKYDPETKRTKKITEQFLGTITEENGLIESKTIRLKREGEISSLSVKEYGVAEFIKHNLQDYTNLLRKHFPTMWQTIIGMAYNRLVYQSPMKNMDFHYQNSYISNIYTDARMSAGTLGQVIRSLGMKREAIVHFFREFSQSEDCVIFDGTDIPSASEQMNLPKKGKSKRGTFESIFNMMCIFSLKQQVPIYYRLLPGNIKDVKSFKLSIEESGITDGILICDKGFYSIANITKLEKENLQYIIPLRRSSTLNDYSIIESGNLTQFEGHFMFNKRCIWYYRSPQNPKVFIYLDDDMKAQERKDFISRMRECDEKGENKEYTVEKLNERQHKFGTISLYTNIQNKTAKEIYCSYKCRGEVEKMIEVFKTVLEVDRTYMQDEQALEGWMFTNYIALHWYYKKYQALYIIDLIEKYSPLDIINFLTEIKAVKINQTWHLAEYTKKTADLLAKLNVAITDNFKS